MKNLLKDKKIVIVIISVVVITLLVFFALFFYKNDSKKIKGAVNEVPVNTSFTDMNFYSCVMDSYNKENNTNFPYDYNLSDEQLSSIKKVVCNDGKAILSNEGNEKYLTGSDDAFYNAKYLYMDSEKENDEDRPNYQISSLDGIEKLTNMEELIMITDNKFSEIDLKENTKLKTLKLGSRRIEFKNATSLENLEIYEWYPTSTSSKYVTTRLYGIASMVNLKKLIVHDAAIMDKASFGNLKNLEELVLYKTDFYNIDVLKDLEKLKKLTVKHLKRLEGATGYAFVFNINEHKYLPNLEYLSTTFLFDNRNNKYLPFENLKTFEGYITNSMNEPVFDVSYLMPNLESLLTLSFYQSELNLSEFIPGIEKLEKLNYLSLSNTRITLDNLDDLKSLKTLELSGFSHKVTSMSNSIETLYGTVSDYSKFPNLKYYAHPPQTYNFDENTNTNMSNKIEEIYNFAYECNRFFENYDTYSNLKILAGRDDGYYFNSELNANNLHKMPNIEKLITHQITSSNNFDPSCTDDSCFSVDFKNNTKLKYLEFETSFKILNIDKLLMLETLNLGYYDEDGDAYKNVIFGEYNNLKKLILEFGGEDSKQTVDLSKMKNVEYLDIQTYYEDYNPINVTNITSLANLKSADLYNILIDNLDFTNCKNLESLEIGKIDIYGLDISTNENIKFLRFNNIYHKYDGSYAPLYIKKGDKIKGLPNVKLPSYIKLEFIEHSNVLEKKEADLLIGVEQGTSEVRYKITNEKVPKYKDVLWTWNGPMEYDSFYVSVIDVNLLSKKFIINNEQNYIYVKNTTKEKDIIRNINFLPYEENLGVLHGVVFKNKFKTFLLLNEFQELDLIKITSNKYKIEDNNIIYYGKFNIDNIRVTNADKEVKNDKLIIKYNGINVDEFNLVKLNDLIGDTNGDGEITISDMILQYKHTEYELDLQEDAFFRADIDSNDDVENSDINALYNIIKNK